MKTTHHITIFCIVCVIYAMSIATSEVSRADVPKPPTFKVSFIPKPWEVNTERQYIQLRDGWRFFKEPMSAKVALYDATGDATDPKEFTLRDGTKRAIGDRCEKPWTTSCDDTSWVTVSAPHNVYDLGYEMDRFKGVMWYRKEVDVSDNLVGRRAVIHFWGAFYRATVYFNGERVGSHEGGHTPFAVDITDRLRSGKNLIAVRVDNIIGPLDMQIGDWWNYGGLHREVFIEFTAPDHIAELRISPELDKNYASGEVRFDVATQNAEGKKLVVYAYRLLDDKLIPVGAASESVHSENTTLRLHISKPALWSPESPALYFAKAVLYDGNSAVDGVGDVFGFRNFEIRGEALYLNGKPIFLRGVNRHDEMAHGDFPDGSRATTDEERIGDFQLIKELGANAMRTAHYPNHPYNYYITDRLGIITIEEGGPVHGQLDNDGLIDKYKQQIREMVARDRNHPSIVMWSIGNEFGGDTYLKCIRELAALSREIDTRPLIFTETSGQIVFEGYRYVDVVARNEYIGWYEGTGNKTVMTPAELEAAISANLPRLIELYHAQNKGKPIIIMETGAEAVAGRRSASPDQLERGSEEYQAFVLEQQFKILRRYPYVNGGLIWILNDFKTRRDKGTCQFTPHLNQKGLVSFRREKKLSFTTMQKIYKDIAAAYEK